MLNKRKRDCDSHSHITTYGHGLLWHRTKPISRPETYGPTHIATLKKPRFRHPNNPLPVSFVVKSAALPADVALLKKELLLFKTLAGSPFICTCLGEEITYGGDVNTGFVPIHNILLEHSVSNLGLLIQDKNKLPEAKVRRITRGLLKGVSCLHSRGYVHCGINPEILLIFYDMGRVSTKIGDLGFVKKENEKKKVKISGYLRENMRYLAPEVVGESTQKGPSDIWAVGCVVIEMLMGKSMWDGKNDKEVEEGLLKIWERTEKVQIPKEVSGLANGFLRACLDRKPSRRSMAVMLLDHPFVAFDGEESKGEHYDKVM